MSNYIAKAVNPKTSKVENAVYIDNYFGIHEYGVMFDDLIVYPIEDIETFDPNEGFVENDIEVKIDEEV